MSDKINDGGPAFPNHYEDRTMKGVRNTVVADGMSLRDWFAGMALQGLLAMCAGPQISGATAEVTAKIAFEHADAMIAEGNKTNAYTP